MQISKLWITIHKPEFGLFHSRGIQFAECAFHATCIAVPFESLWKASGSFSLTFFFLYLFALKRRLYSLFRFLCPQTALTLIHNIATKNMGSFCSEHSFHSLDLAVANATNAHESSRQKVDLAASVLQDVGLLNRSGELLCFVGANCLVKYSYHGSGAWVQRPTENMRCTAFCRFSLSGSSFCAADRIWQLWFLSGRLTDFVMSNF